MQYRIEGMDCASCVRKIETALERMPGVSDIQLNFATEKLELSILKRPSSAWVLAYLPLLIKQTQQTALVIIY